MATEIFGHLSHAFIVIEDNSQKKVC